MPANFRQLLAEKDRLIRIFALGRVAHPVVIELAAMSGGYDGIWLDQEHAGLTAEQITMASITAHGRGLGCFVRMPMVHYSLVNQALESGADGVMAARVESAAEAAEFVRWTKFAPAGLRGLNPGGADGDYSRKTIPELVASANREQMVAIQIETAAAVEDADAIAAVEEVDLLFVGSSDLSQELGVTGQPHHDKIWEAIDTVAAACHRHGKAWASVSTDPEYAARAVEKGCRMLSFGTDVESVRRGIDAIQQRYANFFSSD